MPIDTIEVTKLSHSISADSNVARAFYHVVFRTISSDMESAEHIYTNSFLTCARNDLPAQCKSQVESGNIISLDTLNRIPEEMYIRNAKNVYWHIADQFKTSGIFKDAQFGRNVTICETDTFDYVVCI